MKKRDILISLEEKAVEQADREATSQGISRTELVRRMVDKQLFDDRVEQPDLEFLEKRFPESLLFKFPSKNGAACHILLHLKRLESLLETLIGEVKKIRK